MIRYFQNYIGLVSVLSVVCFLVCAAAVAHQIACLLRKRKNNYLASEIGIMLALGLLDSINRFTYIFSDVGSHFCGADLGRTDMGVITNALLDACFIPHTLILSLYATLLCLGLNIAIKWRTSGSRVRATSGASPDP